MNFHFNKIRYCLLMVLHTTLANLLASALTPDDMQLNITQFIQNFDNPFVQLIYIENDQVDIAEPINPIILTSTRWIERIPKCGVHTTSCCGVFCSNTTKNAVEKLLSGKYNSVIIILMFLN